MNTSTPTALFLDHWFGPVLCHIEAFKTKRRGERVTRYRWHRVDGMNCHSGVFTSPERAVAAVRRDQRFQNVEA
jgi:hypothetical protein